MWEYLPDALREYSPRWEQAVGASSKDVFGSLYADPSRLRQFAMFMNAGSIPQGQEIGERFDFSPFQCLMDVAGGIAVQIGLRYPHLRGIVMDMAPICKVAEEYWWPANRARASATRPNTGRCWRKPDSGRWK